MRPIKEYECSLIDRGAIIQITKAKGQSAYLALKTLLGPDRGVYPWANDTATNRNLLPDNLSNPGEYWVAYERKGK